MIRQESDAPVWAASMAITVDGSALTEFMYDVPVLVRLEEPMFDHSLSRLHGEDIGFYSEPFEPGMEPMDHAIAEWNPNAASFFWVRLPLITPGSLVTFHMHVGSENASVAENPEGVWRNGYAAVLGFDDPDARYTDATRFANHGEVNVEGQSEPTSVAGIIGEAISLSRLTDAVVIPNSSTVEGLAPFTFSAWIRGPEGFGNGRLFEKGGHFINVKDNGTQTRFQVKIGHTIDRLFREWDTTGMPADTWTHVAVVWTGSANSGSLTLLVDGNGADTPVVSNVGPGESAAGTLERYSGSSFTIGNGTGFGADRAFGRFAGSEDPGPFGAIDQFSVSFVPRSANWVAVHVDTVRQTNMSYGPLVRR